MRDAFSAALPFDECGFLVCGPDLGLDPTSGDSEFAGPYFADELKIRLQSGEISRTTRIWRSGIHNEWLQIIEYPPLAKFLGL